MCRRSPHYFLSGEAGVIGCEPPVDFGPGVTPALFSVDPFESLPAVGSEFGFAPVVGPLPASFVDVAPFVGPLPASAFGCAKAEAEKPIAIIDMSMLLLNEDIRTSFLYMLSNSIRGGRSKFRRMGLFAKKLAQTCGRFVPYATWNRLASRG